MERTDNDDWIGCEDLICIHSRPISSVAQGLKSFGGVRKRAVGLHIDSEVQSLAAAGHIEDAAWVMVSAVVIGVL